MSILKKGEFYTESDSSIGRWQGGALNLSQALADAEGPPGSSKTHRFWGEAVAAQPKRLGDGVPEDASSLGWGTGGS